MQCKKVHTGTNFGGKPFPLLLVRVLLLGPNPPSSGGNAARYCAEWPAEGFTLAEGAHCRRLVLPAAGKTGPEGPADAGLNYHPHNKKTVYRDTIGSVSTNGPC